MNADCGSTGSGIYNLESIIHTFHNLSVCKQFHYPSLLHCYSLLPADIDPVQMFRDFLINTEGKTPSEILLALRRLLGNLPADITFPREVSEVSWLMLD